MTTVNRLAGVRAYYRYLGGRDPTKGVRIKRPRALPVRPFTAEEQQRLLAVCRSPRERLVVTLLLSTGLRASELLSLTRSDISLESRTVRVYGKGSKWRLVGLSDASVAALRASMDGPGPLVRAARRDKGPELGYAGLRWMLARLGQRAGVEECRAHRFRVTFATEFLARGGNLQALQMLMGHSFVSTTAHYSAYAAADRALALQRRLWAG